MLLDILKSRVKKAGQAPGTPIYTGDEEKGESCITVVHYTQEGSIRKISATDWETCTSFVDQKEGVTWVNIEGLSNTILVEQVAEHYGLHPLTIEDILNVEQRAKVEEFDDYYFLVLRMLVWPKDQETFSIEQISVVFGEHFVLSFQEKGFHLFDTIRERLCAPTTQRMRQHGPDYLAYRLIDSVVDQYFIVLEQLNEHIEEIEDVIMTNPSPDNAHRLYFLKHQTLTIRKVFWPMREAISHLLQCDNELISAFTRVYLRDAYDHIAQAIDAMENFRDVLASMMDVYLTSLSSRMNEIMKVLTIISTLFIPINFIASIFGMNFEYMPILHGHWNFHIALGAMGIVAFSMLCYFRHKKWF
jgi:magnesium transporter